MSAEVFNSPRNPIERAPLVGDGLDVRMIEPGGPCLAYAVKEGSTVALGQAGFSQSEDIRVAWERDFNTGSIRRWERHQIGPEEIVVQVYSGVSSADSFGDGKLVETYRCIQKKSRTDAERSVWAMQIVRGPNTGATVYPYMDVPMRPLQIAQEAPQREVVGQEDNPPGRDDRFAPDEGAA